MQKRERVDLERVFNIIALDVQAAIDGREAQADEEQEHGGDGGRRSAGPGPENQHDARDRFRPGDAEGCESDEVIGQVKLVRHDRGGKNLGAELFPRRGGA